jgi:DNA-binding XRE family transcriptional regulator
MTRALASRPAALYRMFGGNGELLYVGASINPLDRANQHSLGQPWWTKVREIKVEVFDDPRSALDAERAAVAAERPLYNQISGGAANRATYAEPRQRRRLRFDVRAARLNAGLTQRELARVSGASPVAIRALEVGDSASDLGMTLIARYFGIDAAELAPLEPEVAR